MLTTVVIYAGSNEIDADVLMVIHGVALVLAVFGIMLMLIFASNTHRSTLYKTNMITKQSVQQYFANDDVPLDSTFTTHDEVRLYVFTFVHPYYFEEAKEKVKQCILGLKVTDDLFSSGVVPKGCYGLKGQAFKSAFKRVKYHYEYFNDMEGSELINDHLDALLVEVCAIMDKLEHERENNQQKKAKTATTMPPPAKIQYNDKDATIREQRKLIETRINHNEELRRENEKLLEELERWRNAKTT